MMMIKYSLNTQTNFNDGENKLKRDENYKLCNDIIFFLINTLRVKSVREKSRSRRVSSWTSLGIWKHVWECRFTEEKKLASFKFSQEKTESFWKLQIVRKNFCVWCGGKLHIKLVNYKIQIVVHKKS